MSVIVDIVARQVLDSRGNPTVEVDVMTDTGAKVEQRYQVGPQRVSTKQ